MKKRTTIYLDENSQLMINEMIDVLDMTQTDLIKMAIRELYVGTNYQAKKELYKKLNKNN